jgi:aspartate racemase
VPQSLDADQFGTPAEGALKRMAPRRLGVLGGMGPAATADFMMKVIRATPAASDQEHIPMVVANLPQVPDRTPSVLANDDRPLAAMLESLRLLESAGAELIAIACNTAHFWFDKLASETRLPILHIADAAAEDIQRFAKSPKSILILGTQGTQVAGIYPDRFKSFGLRTQNPTHDQQVIVDQIIQFVKLGDLFAAQILAEKAYEQWSKEAPESVFVLACTELPLAFEGVVGDVPMIDATEALARRCVAFCGPPAKPSSSL